MNSKYFDLFDDLVRSYYCGNFDETLNKIITCHEISPQETFSIITSLCGVSIPFDNNFVSNLKKAISDYTVNKRIIEKIQCTTNCEENNDNKFKCQIACPFDAITFDSNINSTVIDEDKCVYCGACINVCKDGKILDKIQFIPILNLLKEHKTVIAAVDPSIIGQFGDDVTMDQLRASFISIGFSDMIEVALTVDMLAIKDAIQFNNSIHSSHNLMLTSSYCPIWTAMLNKVSNSLPTNLCPSVSPMIIAGRVIKTLTPDAKVVFISPCIAKKAEAKESELLGAIDFVLTFQEVDEIFRTLGVKPSKLNGIPTKEYTSKGGRLSARAGGTSIALSDVIEELYPDKLQFFNSYIAQGINECNLVLDKGVSGELNNNTFIEGMACIGGCVGGPKTLVPPAQGKLLVESFAYTSAIKVPTHSTTIDKVLNKLGIDSLDDFNNEDKVKIFQKEFEI